MLHLFGMYVCTVGCRISVCTAVEVLATIYAFSSAFSRKVISDNQVFLQAMCTTV